MKANKIPTEKRLRMRISALEGRRDAGWAKTRKRFYQFCRHCDRDIISVSMEGHHRGCPLKGIEAEIRHYQALLDLLVQNPSEK